MRRLLLLTALAVALGGVSGAAAARAPSAEAMAPTLSGARVRVTPRPRRRVRHARRARLAPTVIDAETAAASELAAAPTAADATSWGGLPLTVTVVDGDTGASLAGSVRLVRSDDGRVSKREIDDLEWTRLRFDGATHRIAHTYAESGSSVRLLFDVDPPAGYMLVGEGLVERSAKISRFARSLRATIPVRRALEVDFDIRSESGHRITRRLREITVYVAGRRFVVPTGTPHRVRVPYLRGESLYALVRASNSWAEVWAPLADVPRMTVPVRVPRRRDDLSNAGHYRGPAGEVPCCGFGPTWIGTSTLDVWVRRFRGDPAAGVIVRLVHLTERRVRDSERVSDAGRAHFTGLPPGEYELTVAEPGFVTSTARVTLDRDDAGTVTIDEHPGVTGEVWVRGPTGLPLPFARVRLTDREHHAGLDPDGAQQLDHHTDASGRCVIQRLSPFPVSMWVDWAGGVHLGTWTPGQALHVSTTERVYLTKR